MDQESAEQMLQSSSLASRITCNVSHSFDDRPILFLPDRNKHPDIPRGWTPVVADGNQYEANFVQIAINVLRKPGVAENILPELLRSWFGPDAGKPGRGEKISLELSTSHYRMIPIDGTLQETPQAFSIFTTGQLPANADLLAPDGSAIRVLATGERGSMAHGTLPPGGVSLAIRHRTVEELWFVTAGHGQLWRKLGDYEEIVDLARGSSISIPVGAAFQFRNTSPTEPFAFIMCTMPPWPGPDEAEFVYGPWTVKS